MGKLKLYGSIFLVFLVAGTAVAAWYWRPALWAFVVVGPLAVVLAYDMLQKSHTILRNYPGVGHIRYMLEDFRHQFRQYLIQSDNEGDPFTHEQRALVYRRAKAVNDVLPFGTIRNVYSEGYEWINHSVAAREVAEEEPRIRIGGPQCDRPYLASRLNISAMSFGSLSSHAVLALNGGARLGNFAHNTGEGGISRYHREPGGDLVWEIGSGYFGCRTADGRFDPGLFEDQARPDQVKMIELKLSQGAKPGGGGILPAEKLTRDIAEARRVPMGRDVVSPASHTAFRTPVEMLEFMARLRQLSGGKPVGFKLCVGQPSQVMAICKAMLETGIHPDFVTVDGGEGGTGAAPLELSNHMGMPMHEGLLIVHNALTGIGLRDRIRVIVAGKVISGFDMAARIAMGADACYSARGMMFALGCIQARRCHTNRCPTGVATQDPWRVHGLEVGDKTRRVANYHKNTIRHLLKVVAAAGLDHPGQLCPDILYHRVSGTETRSYRDMCDYLEDGALVSGAVPERYRRAWEAASARSF